MIKNVGSNQVRVRWNGREAVLEPGESFDAVGFNILHDEAAVVEARLVGKFPGELEIVDESEPMQEKDSETESNVPKKRGRPKKVEE